MTERIELRRYQTAGGRDVFGEWLAGLKDIRTKAKILARVDRLSLGNFGDCKPLGAGLFELRIDWGPGYRVYYATIGRTCVLLLCGGDKSRQSADIRRATEYLKDYRERTR
jgi:putative addiction module killer protein